MIPLKTQFTYDGFFFRQIKRDGDLVLLEKRKANHTRPSFEVVVVQHHPAQVVSGREYPAREAMPRSEAWGTLGWSYVDLDSATARFRQLVAAREKLSSALTPFPASAS